MSSDITIEDIADAIGRVALEEIAYPDTTDTIPLRFGVSEERLDELVQEHALNAIRRILVPETKVWLEHALLLAKANREGGV